MDTDRLSRWLSIGANLAVLASIIFLAIEIRQNTEMTRAEITLGRSQNALALADMQFNSDYIPDIIVKTMNGEELTQVESYRYGTHLRALFRVQDNNFQQYKRGLLGDHVPRNIRLLVERFIVNKPIGTEWWTNTSQVFSDEFAEFVDAVISEASEGEPN